MTDAERDREYVWHPFTQMAGWEPLVIVAADGCWLIDREGRRYLDGVSSLWVNVHGHRRAEIDRAIVQQLGRVAHSTLLGLASLPSIDLAERLTALAPPGLRKVFYSDSGSTAVEIALKLAFQYFRNQGHHQRRRFLALENGYHGDTLGAVAVGGIDLFHQIFHPLLFHVERIPPDAEALEAFLARHGAELCAFIVEPLIQGAAGMRIQPGGFLRRARELCNEHGVLLIADEVATGFGRTGTMFACEQEGVSPDFLCLAKGITGGYLPMAATLTTERVFRAFLGTPAEQRTFFHGHSYTGNPLACAAALASLEVFEKDRVLQALPGKIEHLQGLLQQELGRHPAVREIRQRGLMVGVELAERGNRPLNGAEVCKKVRDFGVILRPLGNVVVLLPPLCITDDELALLVRATRQAIDAVVEVNRSPT